MRVGELTLSEHVVKACNVHVGENKNKILLMLSSSKTHSKGSKPQRIKIISGLPEGTEKCIHRNFCPFKLLSNHLEMRGGYVTFEESLFIFRDGFPVTPAHAKATLKWVITKLGLDANVYGVHSLRIERSTDLGNLTIL